MLKPLLAAAAALAAVAAPVHAASGCAGTALYQVQHNPVHPLPHGGGGDPPGMVMPGDPVGYVQYDVAAVVNAVKCAGP